MIYTATKQKAADATNANGLQTYTSNADFRSGTAIEQAPTEIALFALAGYVVHKGIASDVTERQAFAKQVEVCT
ncbi:MAG: hypothetical protein Q7U05_08770 [Polaromonas sp.]|nr:hypothetical protein [Polaromonas sp.]